MLKFASDWMMWERHAFNIYNPSLKKRISACRCTDRFAVFPTANNLCHDGRYPPLQTGLGKSGGTILLQLDAVTPLLGSL